MTGTTSDTVQTELMSGFTATDTAFHVEAYEKIDYSLLYVDGAFAVANTEIADSYRPFGRCLMVVDETVYGLYGEQIRAYFDHHRHRPDRVPGGRSGRPTKTWGTVERIVDAFGDFGLLRKEPVLVVGRRADHRRGRLRLRHPTAAPPTTSGCRPP